MNLISNAVKFTEKGFVRLTARPVRSSEFKVQRKEIYQLKPESPESTEFDEIEISVSDSGIGIKENDLPKLFSSFVRLDSPLKGIVPGTGLGLYLTKKLVTQVLKGEIKVKSEVGIGSTFTVLFPLKGGS